ncbi:MAG: CCA tRNA nucleotidyltransferase [Huintestinicola sp.]
MDINIPQNIKQVLKRLELGGYEAYIVGGCVRDSILGRIPSDFDVATNALPEDIIRCMNGMKVIETGLKHGTVTVVSGGENVEVTTYRIDGEYTDHRRPESVQFTSSLEADLARRDFTINAMAYSDKTGIIDIYGGQKDLFNRRLRCVGKPEKRFEEDALRIMRALRFASQLEFSIDKETSLAIHEKRQLLSDISAERISSELTLLVMGIAPAEVLIEYSDVFTLIIPEFRACIDFDQHSRYHVYDVWEHTAHAVQNSRCEKEIRLALLFHDIEKPSCFRTDEEGVGHFPNHEKRSSDTAEKIMQRLRFDKATTDTVCRLIKYHYITPVDDKRVVKRLISILGFDDFNRLAEVMKGDSRAKQSFCLERVSILDDMKIRAYEISANKECCTLRDLAINGNDLSDIGMEGKAIGETLEKLLVMVIEEKIINNREVLIDKAREFGV